MTRVSTRGTHGYSPDKPDLTSFFLIAGSGIREGTSVGQIDMRSIAPTLAKTLGVKLPAAESAPVGIEDQVRL